MIRYFKAEAHGDVVYIAAGDENSAFQVLTSKFGPIPRREVVFTQVDKADIPEGSDIL